LNFISDITKELIKDVVGQKIYYFPVSEIKTQVHEIYNESLKKIFDSPIELDALVDNNFQSDTKIDQFGVDAQYKVEVFIQHRDLVEKGINVSIGDFFSFGQVFYEITEKTFMRNIYGMPEHKDGVKLVGSRARVGQFDAPIFGPTDISNTDSDAVQETFVQQRGFEVNAAEEPTGDVRDLVRNGVLDRPLSGPKEVSPTGDATGAGSAFYDED
jgi:hypothetical protein